MAKQPATKEPLPSHALAELYAARALDPIIEVARAVSEDFVRRPHLYARVPDDVTGLLVNFRSLSGNHPEWPNASQRAFASGPAVTRFSQGFAGIRLSAILFLERTSGPGDSMGRRAFVEAAALLRANVRPLEGAALSAIERASSGMLKRAVTVLGSNQVSAAFGVAEVPAGDGSRGGISGDWPDRGIFSPQLGYLCESISRTLSLDRAILQRTVSVLQRAAHYGADTIARVLDPSLKDADSDPVLDAVHSASAWAAALGELLAHIDVGRAWKDPAYRSRLHCLERDLVPPHPSGEISVEGTISTASAYYHRSPVLGFSTETVNTRFAVPVATSAPPAQTGIVTKAMTAATNARPSSDQFTELIASGGRHSRNAK